MSANSLDPSLVNISLWTSTILLMYFSYKIANEEYKKNGVIYNYYPWRTYLFFAPIYEELLFRGIILLAMYTYFGFWGSIIYSSALFGLWHLRNIRYQPWDVTLKQCLYTGLVLGPIFAYTTLIFGNIFIPIALHALNNFLAPITQNLYKKVIPK